MYLITCPLLEKQKQVDERQTPQMCVFASKQATNAAVWVDPEHGGGVSVVKE